MTAGSRVRALVGALLALALLTPSTPTQTQAELPFTLLVMDPLSASLACDCVGGYAQRDYDALGAWLRTRLGHPVRVVYTESLPAALAGKAEGRVDLVVGKHSVVLHDAHRAGIAVTPLLSLSGKDDATTQTGLLVVRADDPARQVSDLGGYRIFFGPEEAEEKHAAAMALLRAAGLPVPAPPEILSSCSEAALALLDLEADTRAAAVLSSYAKSLLEGCGTIDAGALRVVGSTEPVAFIAAFATDRVAPQDHERLRAALSAVGQDSLLCAQLETGGGFVPYRAPVPAPTPWPGWRGAGRDGRVPWLPDRLPEERQLLWEHRLVQQGLAGVAATERYVIVADRDTEDTRDIWLCLDAATGEPVWTLRYEALGDLDYGNSPRATPQIHAGRVYLLGAHGHLHCVALDSGEVLWEKDLAVAFQVDPPTWGYCASPLIADGLLVVNPGAADASIVALELGSGEVAWKTPGGEAAYAAFLVDDLGGRRQLVGYDAASLGGWDPATGERLWELLPEAEGDFNVPTPVVVGGMLALSSENNGTRLYRFGADGTIVPEPVAEFIDLAPDTTTPVVTAGRLFGNWLDLYCLDLEGGLRLLWAGEDRGYEEHASLIASDDRVLFISGWGELKLLDARAAQHRVLSRGWVFDEPCEVYSHPALVGDRLYVRGAEAIRCLRLSGG